MHEGVHRPDRTHLGALADGAQEGTCVGSEQPICSSWACNGRDAWHRLDGSHSCTLFLPRISQSAQTLDCITLHYIVYISLHYITMVFCKLHYIYIPPLPSHMQCKLKCVPRVVCGHQYVNVLVGIWKITISGNVIIVPVNGRKRHQCNLQRV